MSIIICGPLAIRQADGAFMAEDEVVVGHCHNFDHPTFVRNGSFEICLLNVTEVNVDGNPLKADVEETFNIHADDEVNCLLILAGRWHSLRAKEDRSRYQCIYPHRTPTSLTIGGPGKRQQEPWTKTDEHGDLWVRVDKNIVMVANGWAPASE